MPRVTIEQLSRLLDGEVAPEERQRIEEELTANPVVQAMLERLRDLSRTVAGDILRQPSPPAEATGPQCLGDEALLKLADNLLPPGELRVIEAHINECPRCLARVVESLRAAASMAGGHWPELPDSVKGERDVRLLVHAMKRPEDEDELATLRYVLEEGNAFRTAVSGGALTAGVAIAPASRNAVEVMLEITAASSPQVQQEVIVTDSQTHRKVAGGRANAFGRYQIKRLRPGRYNIHFPGSSLVIQLQIVE